MGPIETLRRLDARDVGACAALGLSLGWTASAALWRSFLALGEGLGVAREDGALIGMVIANRFDDALTMVALMGVHPDHRRTGVGRRLMQRLHAESRGAVVCLYASPLGEKLYASLGYEVVGSSTRFGGPGFVSAVPSTACLRPMREQDLAAVVALDAEAQGARRERLLREHFAKHEGAWVVDRGAGPVAFGMAFRHAARHVGPIVAPTAEDALQLAERLGSGADAIVVDLEPGDTSLAGWVAARGLEPVEESPRMTLGGLPLPGRRAWVRTLAGRPYG